MWNQNPARRLHAIISNNNYKWKFNLREKGTSVAYTDTSSLCRKRAINSKSKYILCTSSHGSNQAKKMCRTNQKKSPLFSKVFSYDLRMNRSRIKKCQGLVIGQNVSLCKEIKKWHKPKYLIPPPRFWDFRNSRKCCHHATVGSHSMMRRPKLTGVNSVHLRQIYGIAPGLQRVEHSDA
jgi:hypothetical protein